MKEERPPDQESTRFTHKIRYEPVIVSSNRESIKNKNWNPLGGPPVIFFSIFLRGSYILFRMCDLYKYFFVTLRYKLLLCCSIAVVYWNDGGIPAVPFGRLKAIFSQEKKKKKNRRGFACVRRCPRRHIQKINRSTPSGRERESLLQQT